MGQERYDALRVSKVWAWGEIYLNIGSRNVLDLAQLCDCLLDFISESDWGEYGYAAALEADWFVSRSIFWRVNVPSVPRPPTLRIPNLQNGTVEC
jgi:hypothetical protein